MSVRCHIPEHADMAAEISQLRAENTVLERLVMDAAIGSPPPAVDVDQVIARRPVLPYLSATVDGLSGVIVRADSAGMVVVDGLAHSPAAALELSAAIARTATTAGGRRG